MAATSHRREAPSAGSSDAGMLPAAAVIEAKYSRDVSVSGLALGVALGVGREDAGTQAAAVPAPLAAVVVPTGQGRQATEPAAGANVPMSHGAQSSGAAASSTALKEPAGHRVGRMLPRGQ